MVSRLSLAVALLLLAGCAHDAPLPLPTAPAFVPVIAPDHRYSADEVVALALANDPDLIAARLASGVGAAQARQAAILPNPVASADVLPLLSGVGDVSAWSLGITQDIRAIVTYRPHVRAARDTARAVAANVVWQEWQVAGEARQLADDCIAADRMRPIMAMGVDALSGRAARLDAAVAAHAASLAELAASRAALTSARAALADLDQQQLARRQQLNALIGLAPDAPLLLAATPDPPKFDPTAIRAALPTLADRRPDLVALRLGSAAAEAQAREAILGQFPALVFGGSSSSDNAKVINAGPTMSVPLPIFDRNQGAIAVARASRAQLHAEYAARLMATTAEIDALLAQYALAERQLATVRADLPAARQAAQRAGEAFAAGALDARGFTDLVTNRLTLEQEALMLELALNDRAIVIRTLAGIGLPQVPPAVAEPAR